MSLRALSVLPFLAAFPVPAAAQQDAAARVQQVLEDGFQQARLTMICAGQDEARRDEVSSVWSASVREILMMLDEAGVSPRNISAIAASRDGKTLVVLRGDETAADWQARCAAETSWQGPEALAALQALPAAVRGAL